MEKLGVLCAIPSGKKGQLPTGSYDIISCAESPRTAPLVIVESSLSVMTPPPLLVGDRAKRVSKARRGEMTPSPL
jgi:hypothetical protein